MLSNSHARRPFRIAVLALLLAAAPVSTAWSQEPLVDEAELASILAVGRHQSRVQDHLWELCKDIGPRLTSSTNLERAYEWARARFASFGLDARIEQYGEWAVGFDRGAFQGGMVSPETRAYTFITHAWTRGTDGPVRAPAIAHPNTLEELEAVRPRLAGAWLVQPERTRGDDRLPKEVRDAVREAADAAGVAGTIRRGTSNGLLITFGNPPESIDAVPAGVNVTVHPDDYDDLAARLTRGESLELEFDIQNHFREGPVRLCNVVADLRGVELPDEYVIVQAHLDSWDGAEGAQDNGTGVATTLEAARILATAGVKPRRTIRFVLYSGEEQGLFGSEGYVETHADELARTSIVLNHDNGTNYLAGIGATQPMRADFERVFAAVKALDPARPFEIREIEGVRPGPSDHTPFVLKGVPAFHWDQDQYGYQFIHHTQNDTYEMADPADQRHSSLVVAISSLGFADLDHLVDRTDMNPPEDRKMGVQLDGTKVVRVISGGRASTAGWLEGDVIVAVDGAQAESQSQVVRLVQDGAARKTIRLQRGTELVETTLDWTDDPDEPRRAEWAARREARKQAEAEAKAAKGGE